MLERAPAAAAEETYDLIVVGGGVYGIALTLEAARRGWRVLLLERGDFAGETSANSLGIVHGGLRYLQSLDARRFRESVAERRWFLRHFPDLVEPLRCLMPLYGRGLRRRSILAIGLAVDALLSARRNTGVRADRRIARGRTLSTSQVMALCPHVDREGLSGGALWSDAAIVDSARLFVEMLRWAVSCGGRCLNYVEAVAPLVDRGAVAGVRASDRIDGVDHEFRSPVVVNCAGPWCREVAARFDPEVGDAELGELFHPSIALNVELRVTDPALREWLSGSPPALAVSPPGSSKAYFLRPAQDGFLAGTLHSSWHGPHPSAVPAELVERLVAELSGCLPALRRSAVEIERVLWGMLPAVRSGSESQARQPVIRDHGAAGGPRGLFSVSGVKLTTARLVAERVLRSIAHRRDGDVRALQAADRPPARTLVAAADFERMLSEEPARAEALVRDIVRRESVVRLDDLLLRRTDWGADPGRHARLRSVLAQSLDLGAAGGTRVDSIRSQEERSHE